MKRYPKKELDFFLKNRKPSRNDISEPHIIPRINKTTYLFEVNYFNPEGERGHTQRRAENSEHAKEVFLAAFPDYVFINAERVGN